jgi:hypothetical protein
MTSRKSGSRWPRVGFERAARIEGATGEVCLEGWPCLAEGVERCEE